MKPSKLTSEEKLAAAKKLRASNFIDPTFEAEHLAWQELVEIEDTSIRTVEGDTHVFIHRAKDHLEDAPLFINIHGGGFVRPHMPCNRYFSAKVAAQIRGTVIDIDYKLAPEYPYPTQMNECYDVALWAKRNASALKCSADRIAIGGHSAGASLALAVSMKGKFLETFKPCLLVLDFGAFDLTEDPADKTNAAENVISVERMRMFTTLYTDDDPHVIWSPYVSPAAAPEELFHGLPETLVLTAGKDSLHEEAEKLGWSIARQGTLVTIRRFKESVHGFTVQCTGEWREAQQMIIMAINRASGVVEKRRTAV